VTLPSYIVFIILDVIWISLVAGTVYKEVLGDSIRDPPGVIAGLGAWICIVGACQVFALPQVLPSKSKGLALAKVIHNIQTLVST
jgi:uncharacterized membrane protein